jgi:hypothetical protein
MLRHCQLNPFEKKLQKKNPTTSRTKKNTNTKLKTTVA